MTSKELCDHVQQCIVEAGNKKSKLPSEGFPLEGMTVLNNCHLLNNICNCKDVNYLEIGLFKGTSFISSLFHNKINSAYVCDNWSEELRGLRGIMKRHYKQIGESNFLRNCAHYNITGFTLFSRDSFTIPLNEIKHKINVYFYDGDHPMESSRKSLTYFYPVLDDTFIFIVDDWKWDFVAKGVRQGIEECKFKIDYEQYLDWGNGFTVFVLNKNEINNARKLEVGHLGNE
jgi:hypothetical protein